MLKKSLIAAVAAITIAASLASPANAGDRTGRVLLGLGVGTALGLGIAAASDRHGYYDNGHYYGGGYGGGYYVAGPSYGYGYRSDRRAYRYWSRECADRWGYETRRFDRCMARHGF
jgi:hypothetical protein